jgi:undecaprenyl-diphosphatase
VNPSASGGLGFGTAAILGLLQGITEFLPISSKGHLVIAGKLLGVHSEGILLEVTLHIGTLLAVVLYYRHDLGPILGAFPRTALGLARGRGPSDEAGRLLIALVVGTIPAILVVLVAGDTIEAIFHSARVTLAGFALTGIVLWTTRRRGEGRGDARILDGLLVGTAQAAAVLPGVSRSGTTIAAGVAAGLSREGAARFSFLLSIPAVLGAVVHELPEILGILTADAGAVPAAAASATASGGAVPTVAAGPLLLGVAVSFISGLAAIKLLLVVARRNRLEVFSWYLWGLAVLGLFILR